MRKGSKTELKANRYMHAGEARSETVWKRPAYVAISSWLASTEPYLFLCILSCTNYKKQYSTVIGRAGNVIVLLSSFA